MPRRCRKSSESTDIRCLSFWQPYASLVVLGHKKFETRGRKILPQGRLLIHAANTKKGFEATASYLPDHTGWYMSEYPFGAIIGEVLVGGTMATIDALNRGLIDGKEKLLGDYSPNRYCTRLLNPVMYSKPIPYRGFQGIFYVPEARLITE